MNIEVRREELIIEVRGAAPGRVGESYVGTVLDGAVVPAPVLPKGQLVIALREEVPEVTMRARVYERVIVEKVVSNDVAVWNDSLRHEQAATEATS